MSKLLTDILSVSALISVIIVLLGIIYKMFALVVKREFTRLFDKLKEIDLKIEKIEKIDDRLDKVETKQEIIIKNLKEKLSIILGVLYD